MKAFRLLLVSLFTAGLLAGCGATPGSGPDAGGAGAGGSGAGMEQQGGGYAGDGQYGGGDGMHRPGASDTDLYGSGGAVTTEPEHRVHFAFDSALLTPEARDMLARNARWIVARNVGRVVVEGHCDERGTREYNLALGQKRADAAKEFLIANGVPASSITTISYGKERPLVHGHDEFAWSKNRRSELVLQ